MCPNNGHPRNDSSTKYVTHPIHNGQGNYRVAFPYRDFITQWKRQKGKESFPYGFYHSQYDVSYMSYIRSYKGEFFFYIYRKFFFLAVASSQVNLKELDLSLDSGSAASHPACMACWQWLDSARLLITSRCRIC